MDEVYLDQTKREFFAGIQYSQDMSSAQMVCSDDKMSYEIVPSENMYSDDYIDAGSVNHETEWFHPSLVDYNFVLEGRDPEELGVPASFLQIKSIDEGEQWYREHTKLPESMIQYVARYHWGDGLVPPPESKKHKPRRNKDKTKFQKNKGTFRVNFD
eukprot:COSAG01_NODE_4462_length_5001_cov_1.631654_5_plen_157_part_00